MSIGSSFVARVDDHGVNGQRLARKQHAMQRIHEQEDTQPPALHPFIDREPSEQRDGHRIVRQTRCLRGRQFLALEACCAQTG